MPNSIAKNKAAALNQQNTASHTVHSLPFSLWIGIAVLLIIADQVSKLYLDHHFIVWERLNLLPFFDFTLVYNTGAAFSFLADSTGWQRCFFIALGLFATIFILFLLKRNKAKTLFCLAITLIMAGALGNVIDRISYGHVIDFLLFYYNEYYFPAFNLADSFITVGVVFLIIDEILRVRQHKEKDS